MDGIGTDVEAISRIPAIPTLLNVIYRTTGMGFVAVARVTETSGWPVACWTRSTSGLLLAAS